ncbi:MAG: BfmA/BtgA family mobilization protein, partial [Bacteroidia bacterium]
MTNIAVDYHTHKDAKILCKTHELTLGELVQHSVVYFKKTGINPSQADTESPYKAIKELDKRVGHLVDLIKVQEEKKLNPLLEHLIIISRQLDDTIKILPTVESFAGVVASINEYIN